MANLGGMNDPTGGQMSEEFKVGEYTLMLAKSDMQESKNKPGNWYLACEFEIEGSPRRVWINYNLKNSNATAEQIAWRDWNSLCHACGRLGSVQDSSEIHGIPFRARVGLEKGSTDRLTFSNPKSLNAAPSRQAGQASAGAAQGQSAPADRPWNRQSA